MADYDLEKLSDSLSDSQHNPENQTMQEENKPQLKQQVRELILLVNLI